MFSFIETIDSLFGVGVGEVALEVNDPMSPGPSPSVSIPASRVLSGFQPESFGL